MKKMGRWLAIAVLASCGGVFPADTAAQQLPTGVQDVCITPEFVGRNAGGGTSSPYQAVDAATRDTISPHNDLGNGMEAVVAYLHGRDSVDVQFTQRARCIERLTDWLRRQGLVVIRAGEQPPDEPEGPGKPEDPEEPEEPEEPTEPGTVGPASDVEVTDGVLSFTPGANAQFHRIDAPAGRFLAAVIMPATSFQLPTGVDPHDVCVQARIGEEEAAACVRVGNVIGGPVTPPPPPPPGPTPPPPPPPPSGGQGHLTGAGWDVPAGAPDYHEDFTAYSGRDDWMARSSLPWRDHTQSRNYGLASFDIHPAGDGTPHAGRGLKMRYRSGTSCAGDNMTDIGPELALSGSNATTIHVEAVISYSPNFTTRSACTTDSGRMDHKTFLAGWSASSGCGQYYRWDYKIGTYGGQVQATVPGFSQCDSVPVRPGNPYIPGDVSTRTQPPETASSNLVDLSGVWDGREHVVRFVMERISDNRYAVRGWIDGVLTHDYWTHSRASAGSSVFTYLKIGSNRNTTADQDMYFYLRDLKVWAR